jgi:hypothetical protein
MLVLVALVTIRQPLRRLPCLKLWRVKRVKRRVKRAKRTC